MKKPTLWGKHNPSSKYFWRDQTDQITATCCTSRTFSCKERCRCCTRRINATKRTSCSRTCHNYKFGLVRFSTDNDATKFYIGFCTYNHLIFSYNFARPSAETMTYWYATVILQNRPNVRAMQLIDELFMFLVRIKLGLCQQDLAHRFNLHMSTLSRKLATWANFLYFLLGNQMIWPSRADVNPFLSKRFPIDE